MPHARFLTYRRALDLSARLAELAAEAPAARRDLAEELRAASTVLVLDIARGFAEPDLAAKLDHYRTARRATLNCEAVLDLLAAHGLERTDLDAVRSEVRRIAGELEDLVLSLERIRTAGA